MKPHLTILAFAVVMLSCKNPKDGSENASAVEEEKPAPAAELKPVWETDTLLTT
jgi:PBP1b-binding outer membrane lipoprotein LpoB